ncbi:MAG: COG1683: Uncharacterized conserved protein / FIG143828: Hypothetical protein YbgA [uncultured Thiotrichaceae bacterium]|uniref:DUF1722 domain-containing protein n=1 Tax=uncultured Thiotrichaceae bacterium TaxID=298394 RepID=A0A6S6TZ04_9GAMM|nr:MAG: COG1683: Uncharacterized conserved protein / FIG143828: Hypothetical protein YbgA [uncultured Thiotrichaceae bacterium]
METQKQFTESLPKIGISSCLLGNKVRFDGGHKNNRYITKTLVNHFGLVSFCPEAGSGMGTPRKPIRLVKQNESVHVVGVDDATQDFTSVLEEYGPQNKETVEHLCGFILKKDSPSCGMERVKVYNADRPDAQPQREGEGVFAKYLRKTFPLLPVEDEGRINDPVLRENFIERVFIYQRWRELQKKNMQPADLVGFHAAHKYTIMAHDQKDAVKLGQLVARCGVGNFSEVADEYIELLMSVLKKRVSRGRHGNVLFHLTGYLREYLDDLERREIVNTIERYQQGLYPLIVPITLLRHYFKKYPHEYIDKQYYLYPHPDELMLRNLL